MYDYDLETIQKTVTEQTEKFKDLSEKSYKLNSEFIEGLMARQSKLLNELGKANSDALSNIGKVDLIEQMAEANQAYLDNLKDTITYVYEESVATYLQHQDNLKEAVASTADAKPASKTKKSSRSA